MYRIIDGRGTGKTSRLMLIAKENHATFICSNPRAMEQKARAYGITGINFRSYSDLLDECFGGAVGLIPDDEVVIDELDSWLKVAMPIISGYSISNED